MNRGAALTLIFIGSIGLYLFVVGLVMPFQFAQFAVVGDNVLQTWDSMGLWQTAYTGQTYVSSGNLVFKPGVGAGAMCVASLTPPAYIQINVLTLEFKTRVVNWAGGDLNFQIYCVDTSPAGWSVIGWFRNEIVQQVDGELLYLPYPNSFIIDNEWHVYTTTFDLTKPEVVAYIDGTQVAKWTRAGGAVYYARLALGFLCMAESGGEAQTDYLKIDSGIKPPTPTPPPTDTGTLRIFASYNGAYVAASASVSGTESRPSAMTSTDVNNPLQYPLKTGAYTVTIIYNGVTKTDPFTLTTSGHDTNLNFGGDPPEPPPNGDTVIDQIIALLKDPTVRAAGSLVSVMLLGVGIIGLIPKSRPKTPSVYQPQYY